MLFKWYNHTNNKNELIMGGGKNKKQRYKMVCMYWLANRYKKRYRHNLHDKMYINVNFGLILTENNPKLNGKR
jgi:hypothetical protein